MVSIVNHQITQSSILVVMADLIKEEEPQPLLDPETAEESPYLRRPRRVEVRRSRSRTLARRLGQALVVAAPLAVIGLAVYATVQFVLHDPRFLLREERVEIQGARYVTRPQVLERFAGDIGRSVFLVPLERRRAMLQEIPWVQTAAVARDWPDRLRVSVREREPAAFLRTPAGLFLADAQGVILERPAGATFTFPVISGFSERDPMEARLRRMRLYLALIEDLDSDGGKHSTDISEVDLSDPEDARVTVTGRDGSGTVLLHLGDSNFLARYRTYLAHIREWRQQFPKIHSVDLRYERQIVVNPDRR